MDEKKKFNLSDLGISFGITIGVAFILIAIQSITTNHMYNTASESLDNTTTSIDTLIENIENGFEPSTKNSLEDSKTFGGYSPIPVYKIYDRETGIYYAVTAHGGITPLYNPDGSFEMVDGGEK